MLSRRAVLAGVPAALAPLTSRAADWRRSLDGLWNIASGTPLERRPPFTSLVLGDADAARYEAREKDVVRGVPGDDVGQDGAEWFTPAEPLLRVRGQARTSIIVDPPDGRLPYTAEGRRALGARLQALGDFDGPESRPLPERCLMGFGDPAAPPMLFAPQTTGDYHFVQTPGALIIRTESNHDVRIVSLGREPAPSPPFRTWHGDSRGRWEGDTLVIQTTRFMDLESLRSLPDRLYLSSDARVTERLTRVSPSEIVYAFVVDDPKVFSRPWRGEAAFRRTEHQVLDYDCQEGNYALPNILRGARASGSR
jgi:hypothetical protein